VTSNYNRCSLYSGGKDDYLAIRSVTLDYNTSKNNNDTTGNLVISLKEKGVEHTLL